MKARVEDLKPFVPEPPPPAAICASCKTFSPEVLLPHGEGSIKLCWLCAHHIVVHGTLIEHAEVGQCKCVPTEIYPAQYFSRPLTTVGK